MKKLVIFLTLYSIAQLSIAASYSINYLAKASGDLNHDGIFDTAKIILNKNDAVTFYHDDSGVICNKPYLYVYLNINDIQTLSLKSHAPFQNYCNYTSYNLSIKDNTLYLKSNIDMTGIVTISRFRFNPKEKYFELVGIEIQYLNSDDGMPSYAINVDYITKLVTVSDLTSGKLILNSYTAHDVIDINSVNTEKVYFEDLVDLQIQVQHMFNSKK